MIEAPIMKTNILSTKALVSPADRSDDSRQRKKEDYGTFKKTS